MRVAYDLRILEPAMHGMARHGLELLRAMLAREAGARFLVLLRSAGQAALLPVDPRVEVVLAPAAPYGLAAQFSLPGLLGRLKPDLYHCPFYAPPVLYGGPMILTVHDLIHLRFPRDHGARHRLFYRLVVGPAARKARAVFTVSEHSRQDIVELLGVQPGRVAITPNAAGPAFRPLPGEERAAAARALGLPESYILGVGNPKPHKNLGALIQAHRLLAQSPPPGLGALPPLALVGVRPGEMPEAPPGPGLIYLPFLDDQGLARAYGAATAVVMPSLYEGFGLPALEALACGAPLLASDRASLPQVVGQAGLLCEPDPTSLAQGLGRLLGDVGLRARLAQAGPAQAARFTWEGAAATALAVYHGVLEGTWP